MIVPPLIRLFFLLLFEQLALLVVSVSSVFASETLSKKTYESQPTNPQYPPFAIFRS